MDMVGCVIRRFLQEVFLSVEKVDFLAICHAYFRVQSEIFSESACPSLLGSCDHKVDLDIFFAETIKQLHLQRKSVFIGNA
jgi:hypothetical protein